VFSSGTLPAIRYIPVPEFIAVAGGLRNVALTSDIGPVHTECVKLAPRSLVIMFLACSCYTANVAINLVVKPLAASTFCRCWRFAASC